jgi:2-polyprenyl-3-methyl-5-hydroxy-6-metoxy-1,4-benzoquinol methylase
MSNVMAAADDGTLLNQHFCDELIADLAKHGYGPKFIDFQVVGIIERRLKPGACKEIKTIEELAAMDTALSYVLGAVWRAQKLILNLSKHREFKAGERYLDVGCGFGATLIGAKKAGLKPTGIELAQYRVKAANFLLEDSGVEAEVLPLNVFDPGFDKLGRFDWITAVNVIEHVNDVRGFVARLAGALAPGGTLFLEIPNFKCIQIAAADPHYGMPLLTLLKHHDAKALFHSRQAVDQYGMPYDVGDYYDLTFFRKCTSEAGLSVKIGPDPISFLTAAAAGSHLRRVLDTLETLDALFPKADAHLREVLIETGWRYFIEASKALGERHAGGLSADDSMRYFAPAFHLYADKPA